MRKPVDRQITESEREASGLKSHVGFWLRLVSNHVSHSFARRLLASGVTVAEWVVLREMFEHGRTAPSTLAEEIGLTRGAISKLIERLLEKRLLTREACDGDRRFQSVALTAKGSRLVPKLAALADENDAEFFAALSAAERRELIAVMQRLAKANHLRGLPTE